MKTDIYTLSYLKEETPVVFYVGRTNDAARRLREHQLLSKKATETTNKYLFIRQLEAQNIGWDLTVVATDVVDESDSEYEWVLLFARHNKEQGLKFIEDLPLCNMRGGDNILTILDDMSIVTSRDIKEWRAREKIVFKKSETTKEWCNSDQKSEEFRLLDRLLRFFDLKQKSVSQEVSKLGEYPSTRNMIYYLLLKPLKPGLPTVYLDQYLSLIDDAEALDLLDTEQEAYQVRLKRQEELFTHLRT